MAVIGLIGGTGLDQWDEPTGRDRIETPFGPTSDELLSFEVGGHQLVFLPRHGSGHTIPPHRINYQANIHALKSLGVEQIIAVNAVGGITAEFGPGVLAIPDQLVDYTWGRAHTFSDSARDPLQHIEFGTPFSIGYRDRIVEAAARAQISIVEHGCIAVTQGPRLETIAEVKRLERDGCDLVGMTTMPEASLAREAGIAYNVIAVVSNWAAGVEDTPISEEAIYATLATAMVNTKRLIEACLSG